MGFPNAFILSGFKDVEDGRHDEYDDDDGDDDDVDDDEDDDDDDDDDDFQNAFTFPGFQTEDGRHGKYLDQETLKISSLCQKHTGGKQ